jgi:hypothetical protein
MTREEAISAMGFLKESVFTSYAEEALDMAIAALREQPRWNSVEERLPEMFGAYLVAGKDGFVGEATLSPVGWFNEAVGCYDTDVTHWMLLPEPPEV